MSLTIGTIKPSTGSTKKRKRIGRGNASGTGTYSGKGLKGQKSRSGVSNLKRLGMKQVLLRTPKSRGFNSLKPDNQVINLTLINDNFKDNDIVDPKALLKKNLVDTIKTPIKILGKGELSINGLKVEGVLVSETAKVQIEKLKGKVTSIKKIKPARNKK